MSQVTVETDTEWPRVVSAAVRPDHTADIETTVEAGTVVTTITRPSLGSLAATLDDYIVAVQVATTVASLANDQPESDGRSDESVDTQSSTHE